MSTRRFRSTRSLRACQSCRGRAPIHPPTPAILLAIARALINDPEIILADEPTGNLDPETSRGIMKLLKSISETGRAVLMATHDYALFEEFPGRLVKFEDGKVLATVE